MNPYLDPNFGDALNQMLYGPQFGQYDEEPDFGGQANQAFRGLPLAIRQRLAAAAGQNRGGAPGVHPAMAQAPQRIPLAVLTEHARGDDVIYGLDSGATLVADGTTVSISTQPQKRHIPKRIALTETVAGQFIMSDLRVGVEPVLATTGNISLAVFIQNSTSPPFRAVICEVGMEVTVVVTNIDTTDKRFTATVIGTYVPPFLR